MSAHKQPSGAPPPYSSVVNQQPPTNEAYVPPGYGLPPQQPPGPYYQQPNSSTVVTVQPVIVRVGDCPACRMGTLEDTFSCVGIMCAIFCFPLGLIPCLLLRNQYCPNCGAIFAGGAPRVYSSPTCTVGTTVVGVTAPPRQYNSR